MLVESVTTAGRNLAPPVQARPPSQNAAPQVGASDAKAPDRMDISQMSEVVADIQKNLDMIHDVDLQFSVHEASGEIMVTVRDEASGEVIREIPPSEMLDLAARLGEMVGLLFDQTG
jgi:flagellar protein FlaG